MKLQDPGHYVFKVTKLYNRFGGIVWCWVTIGGLSSIDHTLQAKIANLTLLFQRLDRFRSQDAYFYSYDTHSHFRSWSICSGWPYQTVLLRFTIYSGLLCVQLQMSIYLSSADGNNPLNMVVWVYADLSSLLLQPTSLLCIVVETSFLPEWCEASPITFLDVALSRWQAVIDEPPPPLDVRHLQRAWNSPQVISSYHTLLENSDQQDSARILASSSRKLGDTLPIASVGLRLSDKEVRISIGLQLGLFRMIVVVVVQALITLGYTDCLAVWARVVSLAIICSITS